MIVPSRVVADDCERLLGVAGERVAVVAEAAAPVFRRVARPREALARFDLPERFLLWVGGLDPPDPRKGISALADAVARADCPPLVLAGRAGREASGLAVPGRVVLAGRAGDDELAALYSAADALVFASSDEGFGLPPHEALACGTPVAAFAAPALVEALSGVAGVRLVPVGDFGALLDAAVAVTGTPVEPPLRGWADVADETIAVYRAAAANAQRNVPEHPL